MVQQQLVVLRCSSSSSLISMQSCSHCRWSPPVVACHGIGEDSVILSFVALVPVSRDGRTICATACLPCHLTPPLLLYT
jgi:hypothetical protein